MSTNIAGNKMLAHMDRVFGKHRPITADIFLNNFCNNKCPYCTYRRWELDKDAYGMKFKDFVKYARRLQGLGVEGFILTGGGEPTITKDFDMITRWLESEGIHYGINTNFNVLKYFSPDYIKVSLDGWDEDSYEANRGVRAYGKVRDNIIAYAEYKRQRSPHTSLGIQKVITKSSEIYPFYDSNKDLPVDYISLRPIESTGGCFYKDKENAEDAERSIKLIKEIAKHDSRVVMNFKWDMLDVSPGDFCVGHWTQIAVNERGKIIYCCHKPYEVVGDLMEDNILEKYEMAVTDMSKCDIPCRLTAPNIFLGKLAEGIKDRMFI